jgi:ribosomal protein L12E/L44/L45/RPP1/RPP2
LEKILKGVSVDGTITKRKLLEIMKGAGAEFSEELIDILIGKMAQNAQNLDSLVYDEIFTIEQT